MHSFLLIFSNLEYSISLKKKKKKIETSKHPKTVAHASRTAIYFLPITLMIIQIKQYSLWKGDTRNKERLISRLYKRNQTKRGQRRPKITQWDDELETKARFRERTHGGF